MTMLLLHFDNSVVCFHLPICIFLDAYNVHKSSNKNFAPVKNHGFRWTIVICTAKLNKNRLFV